VFNGIIPPIITPFNDDLSINEKSFASVIEYMIADGVHAVIVGGTTGENYALTSEERVHQFAVAKDIINGRVPMICGVNDMTTSGAVGLAEAAREKGADGILLAAPPYSLPTERELATHCLLVDRAANLPIMLYNYPGRTGVCMGKEFLSRVGQRNNFMSIKEASGDINRIHLLAREFPHIALSCGAEDQALEFFVWGASSWVTPMANFFCKELVRFYELCQFEKDFDTAREMMTALLPLTTVIEGGGKFAQSVKFCVEFQGMSAGPVRPPMRGLKKEQKRALQEVIETAKISLKLILSDKKTKKDKSHVKLVK
jgi:4-hydroxy-tetrahydrodipicolinate synthase